MPPARKTGHGRTSERYGTATPTTPAPSRSYTDWAMEFTLPPRGIEVILLTLVVGAAIYDVRYRRIPNWLTVSGVLAGIAMNTFLAWPSPQRWSGCAFALKGLALGFALYFLLYALRAMGAGDVKLMAAVGAMVGWQDWFGIFIMTAIIGGIMGATFAVAKGRLGTTFWNVGFILSEMKQGRPAYLRREELDVRHPKSVGLPHGAVIAIGTLFFLAVSLHFAR
jgi:prepilin peptidase CpaA